MGGGQPVRVDVRVVATTNRDLLTEVEAVLLDGHFVLEHGGRNRGGCFFNFNGTAGIWRREVIPDAGGWQHDTLTEDSDLSYRAQMRGWQFVYLPWIECPSELPVDTYSFQVQQSRWAKGLMQVEGTGVLRINPNDAARFMLINGDRVRLSNMRGEITTTVKIVGRIPQGWAWFPDHFGQTAMHLFDCVIDPVTHTPSIRTTSVSIMKVA